MSHFHSSKRSFSSATYRIGVNTKVPRRNAKLQILSRRRIGCVCNGKMRAKRRKFQNTIPSEVWICPGKRRRAFSL